MSIIETSLPELQVRDLRAIALQAGDLPALPDTAMTGMQMMDNPRVNARELQSVIARDQALTARILKIVNSAMYCFEREVSTLSHAITILGLDTVRSILVAAAVQQVFPSGSAGSKDLTTRLFWEHSLGAAVAAKVIAARTGYPVVEEAFTCGLLHDMGKMVLLKNRSTLYREILSEVYRGGATFQEAEQQTFGFTHAHVGALLAQKWHFPQQLVEATLYHHDCLAAPRHRILAAIAALADASMIFLEVGFQKNKSLQLAEEASARHLQLTAPVLQTMILDVQKMILTLPAGARP
jgi:putative nucleotidyltransferase with HDIG domain